MATTDTSGGTTIPWRSRTVQVVLVSTFLAPFSVALVSPGVPVFRDAFGLTDPEASLLLSTILLPGAFLSPLLSFAAVLAVVYSLLLVVLTRFPR